MLYLADNGGGQAIQSLVADTATGGASIENLARNPPGVSWEHWDNNG